MYYPETASTVPAPPEPKAQPDVTKICMNCRYIGKNGSGDASRYKCFAPKNIESKRVDLVTGAAYTVFHYETCYEARLDSGVRCGPEGKWFEEAQAPPKFNEPGNLMPGSDARRQAQATDLLNQLKGL